MTTENEASTEIINDTPTERLAKANDSVKNHTMAAISVGLVPVPMIDMAALTTIQLNMIYSLAKRYEVPFSKNLVKSLVSSLVAGSTPVTVALPLASFLKAIPIIGQTSGMISTSAIGAYSTYAIGHVFITHFESGGTFLDFDMKKAKQQFKELYEEGKKFVGLQKEEAKETTNAQG